MREPKPDPSASAGTSLKRLALAGLSLALVLALSACGSSTDGEGGEPGEAPEPSRVTSGEAPEPSRIACGESFELPSPGRIRVEAQFPRTAAAGKPMLRGTAKVTTAEAVHGVTSEHAGGFLVRDGLVVTTPLPQADIGMPWDTAAGEVREVSVVASLVSCEPGGEPLPAGEYELYVVVTITPDGGKTIQALGGPSPLRLE
jgi:hypothetical protein